MHDNCLEMMTCLSVAKENSQACQKGVRRLHGGMESKIMSQSLKLSRDACPHWGVCTCQPVLRRLFAISSDKSATSFHSADVEGEGP